MSTVARFNEKKLGEIDALIAKCGMQTREELVNSAITLFAWAIRQRERGRAIASVDEAQGVYQEVQMPALEAVAPTGN